MVATGVVDLALEHVGLAEEPGQLGVPRAPVQRRRRVELGDHPPTEHGDLIGHGERLVLVVGHQDGGRAGTAQHAEDIGPDRGAQRGVERRKRLVEQHDLGFDREGAGQRDPLLLAARELVGVTPAVTGQSDELEQLVDPRHSVGAPRKAEAHVATHAQVGEQGALLGDVADAAVLRGHEPLAGVVDDLVPQPDLALVRALEPRNDPQQSRLAAAGRAEDRGERPVRDGQIEPARARGCGPNDLATPWIRRSFTPPPVSWAPARARAHRPGPLSRAGGRTTGRGRSRARPR